MSGESVAQQQTRLSHIYERLSRLEFMMTRYDPKLWVLGLMYIPMTLGYPMIFIANLVLEFVLMMFGVMMFAMYMYIRLINLKESATKGKKYADSRTHIGYDEIIEQIEVIDLITKARPKKPYPYHKARVQEEEIVDSLKPLGGEVKIMEAGAIRKAYDREIAEKVKAGVQEEIDSLRKQGKIVWRSRTRIAKTLAKGGISRDPEIMDASTPDEIKKQLELEEKKRQKEAKEIRKADAKFMKQVRKHQEKLTKLAQKDIQKKFKDSAKEQVEVIDEKIDEKLPVLKETKGEES